MGQFSRIAFGAVSRLFGMSSLCAFLLLTGCGGGGYKSPTMVTPLSIITTTLPDGTVGAAYAQTVQSSGGTPPVKWAVKAGALPPGLALNPNSGVISGTPTGTGTFDFTVTATDSTTPTAQTASHALRINVNATASISCTAPEQNGLLTGQYAFLFQGFDANGGMAQAGTFTADGNGNLTSGTRDLNRGSGVTQSQGFTGTYCIGADNRGAYVIAGTSETYAIAVGKITSSVSSKVRFIEFDTTGTAGSGVIELQNPAAFSNAQIAGDYAFGGASAQVPSASLGKRFGVAGRFTASGTSPGVISAGVFDQNQDGLAFAPTSFTGSYTVALNGRGTLQFVFTVGIPVNIVIYVVSSGELLLMGIDPQVAGGNQLAAGSILQQVGKPFTVSSLNGISVFNTSALSGTTAANIAAGFATTDGAGNFKLSADENNGGTISQPTPSGTYAVDVSGNGRVAISGLINFAIVYLVANNKGFALGADTGVTLAFFEPQAAGPFSNASVSGSFFLGTTNPVEMNVKEESGVATLNNGVVSLTTDSTTSGAAPVAGQATSDTYNVSANGRTTLTTDKNTVIYIISATKAVAINIKAGNSDRAVQIIEK